MTSQALSAPNRPLDVVGVEDPERLVEQLHHLDPQHVEVAERGELEVVAQVQAGPADDGDRCRSSGRRRARG